jgi:hypothetical protein
VKLKTAASKTPRPVSAIVPRWWTSAAPVREPQTGCIAATPSRSAASAVSAKTTGGTASAADFSVATVAPSGPPRGSPSYGRRVGAVPPDIGRRGAARSSLALIAAARAERGAVADRRDVRTPARLEFRLEPAARRAFVVRVELVTSLPGARDEGGSSPGDVVAVAEVGCGTPSAGGVGCSAGGGGPGGEGAVGVVIGGTGGTGGVGGTGGAGGGGGRVGTVTVGTVTVGSGGSCARLLPDQAPSTPATRNVGSKTRTERFRI